MPSAVPSIAAFRPVKSAVVMAYLAAKRDAFLRAGWDRWRATVVYIQWWRPQHELETARALVDASFPGFTPFQVGAAQPCHRQMRYIA